MPAIRAFCFAALAAVALAACDHEPTFDASSLPAYQQSLSDITARLSAADRRKLEVALVTLAGGGGADYAAFGRPSAANAAGFETLVGVANPLIFLDRMRRRIDGKTAAEVIKRVAGDLDVEISRAEARSGGAEKELKSFVVENARFYWDTSHVRNEPMAQFSLYNGSRTAISTIYLSAVLTTPSAKAPLAAGGLLQHFPIPLQPGAQQLVTIYLGSAGEAVTKQFEGIYDADLALKVTNIDDANGKRLLTTSTDVLDIMRSKREVLRGG